MREIVLKEGQKLTEMWEVEFSGQDWRGQPDKRIRCRIKEMYTSAIYGGAHGYGATVDEARLNAVLGLARAICDDPNAFSYNAEEIFKAQQLGWFEGRIQEERDLLDSKDFSHQKTRRRIKLLEQLQAEWQEEHDYWPEVEVQAQRATAAQPT
jgi:hypothetical protein